MKTVYVGHSREFDFLNDLYRPVRESNLGESVNIVFPHEAGVPEISTEQLLRSGCDVFVAEVSYPSTGLGIEIGFARMLGVPVVCFYRQGASVSGSLPRVSDRLVEYSDTNDMIEKLRVIIKEFSK